MERDTIFTDILPDVPREPVRFCRRDWLALLGAAVCAAGYAFCHESVFITGNLHMPGIGLGLSVWLILGLCLLCTGAKHLRRALFPLAAALLLAATYGIFANEALRLMNLPVLIGLTATAAYALSGSGNLFTAAGLTESIYRLSAGTLRHLPAPFLALIGLHGSGDSGRAKGLALGIALCVPVVGLAALLLCNADAAFSAALSGLFRVFEGPNLRANVWNLLRFAGLTLVIFAFLYGLTRWTAPEAEVRRFGLSPLSLGMVLAALCALYAAFLCVQFEQLRAFSGNYARSARAGFFQLVLVALITLLVTLPALTIHPGSPAIRALGALATLLTMGIVASAVWRMALYIRAYGWTLLRMVTLWGILAITAAMLAALVKCARPGVRVCRALAVFTIVTWILFNYVNVDARIAESNVTAFQNHALEQLDADYLASLSPDALPALRRVADESPSLRRTLLLAEQRACARTPGWYDWSLSWRKADAAWESVLGEWRLRFVANLSPDESVYPPYFERGSTLTLSADRSGELRSPEGIGLAFKWELIRDRICAEVEDGPNFFLLLNGTTIHYSCYADSLDCKFER